MGEPKDYSPSDILRGIELIRSADPAERKRGIHMLMVVRHDPRVLQVFEALYEDDLDPGVRREAWHALTQAGPSVPAPSPDSTPGPSPAAAEDAPAVQRPTKRVPFLLDPTNARLVARESREIASRKNGGRFLFALAGLLLLLAVVLWIVVLPDWLSWYRLRQDGVSVAGQIAHLRERDQRYYAEYVFRVGQSNIAQYTGEQRITQAAYERLEPSAPVTVTYLPSDPHLSRLDEQNPGDQRRGWLTLAATALTLFSVSLALLAVDQHGQSRRGQRDWRVQRGQLIECSGRLDEDGDFKVRLRYRFRAPGGQMIVGKTSQIRNDLKESPLPQPGAPVAVYYCMQDGVYRML
jgi:hypothetical protein